MSSFGRLSPNDASSFSRPDLVKVNHLDIHWYLHFEEQFIDGYVKLMVEKIDSSVNELLLDSYGLEIRCVLLLENDESKTLPYTVGKLIPEVGEKISITLPEGEQKSLCIRIDYATSKKAIGLQWLTPAQTGTKKQPFLFSQFQSIHARTAVPCQDTPRLKATYEAEVISPIDVQVLMSARRKEKTVLPDGLFLFKFSQLIAIPSYLIAIAAGELEERKVGPRSSVWAGKDVIEAAAYEFAEVEKMIVAAESICGNYEWGIYDMLILPPSFPYGGMENPNLTFVTPTILAGDRSLVDVIVHEITHSWTGNLVTNINWEHFWLNEGFTMFIERKILGLMHGQKERHLDAICGWKTLEESVKTLGEENPSTRLLPDLTGVDPESNYTVIPYEKGHALLWYLETLVGEEEMTKFLRYYLEYFAPETIDSFQFRELFLQYFSHKKDIIDSVDWDSWWYKPGMPPVELKFDTTLLDCCTSLVEKWLSWGVNAECDFSKDDLKQFSSGQIILWMKMMAEKGPLPIEKLKKLDAVYDLTGYKNNEIRFYWIILGLKSKWDKIIEQAVEFINEQGRMRYTVPIYRELYNWTDVRAITIINFQENRKTMMHCSVQKILKELHLDQ